MLNPNWLKILVLSFCLVALTNSLLASCTALFYRKKPVGRLSHNELRIKQGNATLEQRLNVFGQSLTFSIVTLRVYIFTLLVWLAINCLLYFSN